MLALFSASAAYELGKSSKDKAQVDSELRALFEESQVIHERTKWH